jgi:hypothetical protein
MEDEIHYLQDLIIAHKRRLQTLEQQVALVGKASAPPEKLMEIEDIQKTIDELEQRIRRKIRNSGEEGVYYSTEQVDEIYGKITRVAQLEYRVPVLDSIVQELRKISIGIIRIKE